VNRALALLFDRSRYELSREDLAGTALLMLLLVALPVAFASTGKIFGDGDVSWHIAAGRWMLQHRAIPTVDPFSFTAAGKPWIAMEWLADLLYSGAFSLAGHAGVAGIVAAALIGLQVIVFSHVRRSVGPIGIALTIAAMDAVLGAFLLARPHLLVWPIMAAWTAILLRAAEAGKTPPWWSVLLLVVWTNVHASFPLAIVIAGAIALDALIAAKWRTLPQWTMFLALCVLALLLNANGIRGVLQPFHITELNMLPMIKEWQPSSPALTPQFYGVLLLAVGLLSWRGVKLPIGQLLLLLVLLGLAFKQVRHQEWLAIVAALILPAHFHSEGWPKPGIKPFLLLAVAAVAVRMAVPIVPSETNADPTRLIGAVPTQLRSQPVLNGYSFGGPLILAGIRPYIDGRAEMYGDAFFADYVEITDGNIAAFNRAVQRYDIRWTMLPVSEKELIERIEASGEWRRIYSDDVGVIDVRISRPQRH